MTTKTIEGTMKEKTQEHAAEVLIAIKAEMRSSDVIKSYEMPTLCDMKTGEDTGFVVVLTLNTKYGYTSDLLNEWKERLKADGYTITVRRNQLCVKFNIRF
jgi:hypothetical protein